MKVERRPVRVPEDSDRGRGRGGALSRIQHDQSGTIAEGHVTGFLGPVSARRSRARFRVAVPAEAGQVEVLG